MKCGLSSSANTEWSAWDAASRALFVPKHGISKLTAPRGAGCAVTGSVVIQGLGLPMCITSLNLHQYTLGYIFMFPFDKRGSWGTDCKRQHVRGKTEIHILVCPPSTISEIACLADKSHLPWTLFPKVHLKMLWGDSRQFCSYRRLFWGVCWGGSGAKCT